MNSRYTREGDDFYNLPLLPCNLKDAWIQNVMNGEIPSKGESRMIDDLGQLGEVVDKIWFRSGKNVEINASTFKLLLTEFTDEDGNQLSDHYPITSRIDYKLLDNIKTFDTFGGGEGFSFVEQVGGKYPKSVTVSKGDRVDRVGFTYYEYGLITSGGTGGNEQTYTFKVGEHITPLRVCKAKKNLLKTYHVSYINIITNLNGQLTGGKCGDEDTTFVVPDGYAITGFIGYTSDEVDRIGCVYQKL